MFASGPRGAARAFVPEIERNSGVRAERREDREGEITWGGGVTERWRSCKEDGDREGEIAGGGGDRVGEIVREGRGTE